MARVVERRPLKWYEELYLPAIVSGLGRTFRQMFEPDITLQYPEERPEIHDDYRGAPGLVRDDEGREKCVSCQLCEYICPPKAIVIRPGQIETVEGREVMAVRSETVPLLRIDDVFCMQRTEPVHLLDDALKRPDLASFGKHKR